MVTRRQNQRAKSRQRNPNSKPLQGVYVGELNAFLAHLRRGVTQVGVRLDAVTSDFYATPELTARLRRLYTQWEPTNQDAAVTTIARNLQKKAASYVKQFRLPRFGTRTLNVDAQTIQEFREVNVRLIKTVPLNVVDSLEALLTEEFPAGLHVDALAKVFQRVAGVEESRARFWARDQTLKFNGQVVKNRSVAAGLPGYWWRVNPDERLRDDHDDLADTYHTWDDPPVCDQRTGRREHPGGDYQCRCTAEPAFGPDEA